MVRLKEIDRNNFNDILKLSVFDEQKEFVASTQYSLAQAKAQPECIPLAIYDEDTLVGFVMYCMDYKDNEYWIYRLLIDKAHQKKGFGRAAMQCVLSVLQQDKEHTKVYISFEPENTVAKDLYESLGFVPDGRVLYGEVVYYLNY